MYPSYHPLQSCRVPAEILPFSPYIVGYSPPTMFPRSCHKCCLSGV